MRPREMPHPLCCISLDLGASSRAPPDPPPDPDREAGGVSSVAVAGVLCKWTNIRKGWRYRWFSLHNGVLSYSKIRLRDPPLVLEGSGFRLIGKDAALISSATPASCASNVQPGAAGWGYRKSRKPTRVVRLKISSFRESKTDGKRFYIFSSTKTLHLRTDSRKDRVAWIQALISATKEISIGKEISFMQTDIPISTKKLRDHMQAEGLHEALIKDCEEIMYSEFAEYQRQRKLHYEENLFSVYQQEQLEEVDIEDMVTNEDQVQLTKYDYSSSGHEKFNEYSTTESSDGVEKQELDDLSDQEDLFFYDTNESFVDSAITCDSMAKASDDSDRICGPQLNKCNANMVDAVSQRDDQTTLLHIGRRKKLPEPIEKEKAVSLWSMIKDNVGKDLTRVCLPVYFNEPLSSLQKCFEDLEYSHLLDQAYEYGKKGNSLMRILNVAAFAVSGYSSCDRLCKPFNPLLGETYEADYPEKGIRFFSEKVSHHPMLIACHCEGRGWKFWGDSNLRSKFWGQSIQLDPIGVLTLEFDDGEIFQWSKVTTTIHNLILGKLYCNHHGTMKIRGSQQYSCTLKFKEHSFLDRSPRQVQGFVEDTKGKKVATLLGKWDVNMYYSLGDEDIWKLKSTVLSENASLLWRKNEPPADPTRYNLTSFGITLNELSSELKEKLPPTDSRLRPDQRYLENGEYEKANAEKLRLEKRQRMSRKLQENGWKPKWFQRDSKDGTFLYVGGYWEARDQKKWDDCLDIFGEFSSNPTTEPRNKEELII